MAIGLSASQIKEKPSFFYPREHDEVVGRGSETQVGTKFNTQLDVWKVKISHMPVISYFLYWSLF